MLQQINHHCIGVLKILKHFFHMHNITLTLLVVMQLLNILHKIDLEA